MWLYNALRTSHFEALRGACLRVRLVSCRSVHMTCYSLSKSRVRAQQHWRSRKLKRAKCNSDRFCPLRCSWPVPSSISEPANTFVCTQEVFEEVALACAGRAEFVSAEA